MEVLERQKVAMEVEDDEDLNVSKSIARIAVLVSLWLSVTNPQCPDLSFQFVRNSKMRHEVTKSRNRCQCLVSAVLWRRWVNDNFTNWAVLAATNEIKIRGLTLHIELSSIQSKLAKEEVYMSFCGGDISREDLSRICR